MNAVFMGIPLRIGAGTLVPRPETELLAETAIARLGSEGRETPRVIDMCCGVGNLAIAIANGVPAASVWASDLTTPCVETTRHNVEMNRLTERVKVAQGDLFAGLGGQGLEGGVDLIVCNPPYISTERLSRDRAHLLEKEPREAFDGGPYGLSIHQRVVTEALAFLRPGGWLMFEFGEGQARQLRILFDRARAYDSPHFLQDRTGAERVAAARRRP